MEFNTAATIFSLVVIITCILIKIYDHGEVAQIHAEASSKSKDEDIRIASMILGFLKFQPKFCFTPEQISMFCFKWVISPERCEKCLLALEKKNLIKWQSFNGKIWYSIT